jgi:hypothetical protein
MIKNNDFHLSEEQLSLLNQIVAAHNAAWSAEDCAESFNFTVSFCFHLYGRDVDLQIGSSDQKTNLQNSLDDWIKD